MSKSLNCIQPSTFDVVGHVAGYLRGDPAALYSASTVCRMWYLANRYITGLHRRAYLDHVVFSAIPVDTDTSHMPDVLHVSLKGGRRATGSLGIIKLDPAILGKVAKRFPDVSHLGLIDCSWEHEARLSDTLTISHSFEGVRKLTIRAMCIYECTENLFPLLATLFPSLECLELVDIACADLKVPPAQIPSTFNILIIKNADDIHSLQRVLCPIIQQCPLASLFIEGDQTPDDWLLLNEVVRERVVTLRYDTYTEALSKFSLPIP